MNSLIQPYLTEKSALRIDRGEYVFLIEKNANKATVERDLQAIYGVKPLSVRIVNLPAKKVAFKRVKGVRARIRKAYVQLPPKQTIPGFEGLTQKDEKTTSKENK